MWWEALFSHKSAAFSFQFCSSLHNKRAESSYWRHHLFIHPSMLTKGFKIFCKPEGINKTMKIWDFVWFFFSKITIFFSLRIDKFTYIIQPNRVSYVYSVWQGKLHWSHTYDKIIDKNISTIRNNIKFKTINFSWMTRKMKLALW